MKTLRHVVGLKFHHPWGSISFYHWSPVLLSMSFLFFSFLFSNVSSYKICFLVTEDSDWYVKSSIHLEKTFKSSNVASCSEAHSAGRGPWFYRWFQRRVCISAVIKKHRKCLCFCCLETSVLSSCKQGIWKPLSFICLQLPSREGGMRLSGHLDFVWLW